MGMAKIQKADKKLLTALMLGAAVLCSPNYSLALPDQGHYDNTGAAKITTADKIMNIDGKGPNNILNWQTFDIGENETVRFDNGAFTKNYLNLIHDNGMSLIFGNIEGGKNVYLINPNGFLFGVDSQINVGNLYVSTRYLEDVDKDVFTRSGMLPSLSADKKNLKGDILDFGVIKADTVEFVGKYVILFSRDDIISTKDPVLSAGKEVLIVDDYILDNIDDKEQRRGLAYRRLYSERQFKRAIRNTEMLLFAEFSKQKENDSDRKETMAKILVDTLKSEKDARPILEVIERQNQERMQLLQKHEQQLKDLQEKYANEKQQIPQLFKEKMKDFIRQEQNEMIKQKNNSVHIGENFKEALKNSVIDPPAEDSLHIMERIFVLKEEKKALSELTKKMKQERLAQINRQKEEINSVLSANNVDISLKEALIEAAKR